MKPYKLFHFIYLPIAAISFIITCYYSMGFAEFERESNLSKDLRIQLPEHIIENKLVTSIYDGDGDEGLLLYDSLAYSVLIKAPLSDKSIKIITSEKRGWEKIDSDIYSLRRSIISENMECIYDIEDNKSSINYLYNFDSFGLVLYPIAISITLAIIYILMLIALSLILYVLAKIKQRCS